VFYQVLRITVSSVHDGHHALVLGAIALAFRCRQILVSTVRLPLSERQFKCRSVVNSKFLDSPSSLQC
jgi:hypothetical protein